MAGSRFDIQAHITDQIVSMLAEAKGTTDLPWHTSGGLHRPLNVLTGKPYRGVNILALWMAAAQRGYRSGRWGTYRQWNKVGAQVRKGENAAFVVFYRDLPGNVVTGSDADDDSERNKLRVLARASAVFAAEQVDGYDPPAAPRASHVVTHARAEHLVARSGATVVHGGERAYYTIATDSIHLPSPTAFIGTSTSSPTESYYAVLFHELTHWTGHETRCNRQLGRRFGLDAYAMEELVAELGAAFLCADLGITASPRPDHAHYIASWLDVLKRDKRAIFAAASKASAAVDFLMPGLEAPRRHAEAPSVVQVGTQ
ncbi:ArdC family protein [Rhodoplanes azumiensis]|uniref:ArdC family protein n=1 Tax=Rhodoplanes azumiensis TaxID=1897628 RepID=A0ABW5AHR9_9BRAD